MFSSPYICGSPCLEGCRKESNIEFGSPVLKIMVTNFLPLWYTKKNRIPSINKNGISKFKQICLVEGRIRDLTSPKRAVKISKHKSKVSVNPKKV